MYFLLEETVMHIRFKIRVSEPQRRKQIMCFSPLEKRKWLKYFSPLEKTVTHMLFADLTLLLKDVFIYLFIYLPEMLQKIHNAASIRM